MLKKALIFFLCCTCMPQLFAIVNLEQQIKTVRHPDKNGNLEIEGGERKNWCTAAAQIYASKWKFPHEEGIDLKKRLKVFDVNDNGKIDPREVRQFSKFMKALFQSLLHLP